jgi:hypothetical protein
MTKPLYKHDCVHCVYIKTDHDDFGTISDIYVCGECVTFRYSDHLPDNRSICFEDLGRDFEWFIERNPYAYKILQDFKIMFRLNKLVN